jgi:histone-binding protein RBBP4
LGREINRARYCYANPAIVASSLSNGEVILTYNNEIASKLICHTTEGYGLSWNPKAYQYLATGQSDKRICIWDVEQNKQENNKTTPIM